MSKARYEGRIALVTGAAAGIGRAVVEGLVAEGATVVFSDIDVAAGEALATRLGDRAVFQQSDGTLDEEVRALVEGVVARFGRLDVAINNVGNMARGDANGVRLHEGSTEGWHGTLALSLTSNFLAMKYELAQMVRQGGGVIANAASTAGRRFVPQVTAAYHAGKAGVIHLTEVAAVQYARDNIRVNAIAPGFTFTDAVANAYPAIDDPQLLAAVAHFHAIPRVLDVKEVAAAYLWVCSDEAGGMTGATLPVDCGWIAK